MTTTLKHVLRYDGATVDQVHAMLADQTFREKVCAAQHVLRQTVTITPRGEGMSVKVDQFQAAEGLPSFATRIVGNEINIVQEEEWSSPTAADLSVTIPGKPGDMRGTITLADNAGGVDETVEVTIKVNIPLVGGKVENLISGLLLKALKSENRTGKEWLA